MLGILPFVSIGTPKKWQYSRSILDLKFGGSSQSLIQNIIVLSLFVLPPDALLYNSNMACVSRSSLTLNAIVQTSSA
ncbi:unnamed protein product, partial [Rotaria magnacalcarata]